MSPVTIGTTIEVVDELPPVAAPTNTDPLFLLHTQVTGTVTDLTSAAQAQAAFTGHPGLIAISDTFFREGGRVLHAGHLTTTSGTPDIAASTGQFPASLGPGQVIAPEVNTAAHCAGIAAWAWATNRVYIADGADGASVAALEAIADAIRATTGGRASCVAADTITIPGLASSTTREAPGSVVIAALIARNDAMTGNPNLAAAGVQGECRWSVGIKAERTAADRNSLAAHGVNCFASVYGRTRAYGFRAAVDTATLPAWWDLSGARVVMAVRARAQVIAEDSMFRQVDGNGAFLAALEASLAGELAALQRAGALYGTQTAPGYAVRCGWDQNPVADVKAGHVRADIALRTSPFAEMVTISIIRRQIDQEV